MVKECYAPLHVMVRDSIQSIDFGVETGGTVSRGQLEHKVLADLFENDIRFRRHSGQWARLALGLKGLALEGAAPDAILDELESQMAKIEQPDAADAAGSVQPDERIPHADPVG
jgi:hypothetical protein